MSVQTNNVKKLFYTKMQRDIILTDPKELYCVAGRGTGKSTRIIAKLSANRVLDMPGASFSFTGATYTQLQQRTVASVVAGWADLGLVEGVHWCIGKPKPGWGKPFFTPLDWSKCISFYTGTNFILCSLDRPGMTNSYTFSGIFGDEAKTFDYKVWREDLLPTLRAPKTLFPNSAHNRSIILTTSMPAIPDGQWLLDMQKRQDPRRVELILKLAEELEVVKFMYFKTQSPYAKQKYLAQIKKREADLVKLRKDCVMYYEASTFSVIDILGLDYIQQQKELLEDNFEAEILNIKPSGTKLMFYSGLSRDNFYTNYDYNYIDSFGLLHNQASVNCLRDKDYNPNLPLDIGVDFGVNFNCMVVGQQDISNDVYKIINNFYVEKGGVISEVVNKFCDYYKYTKRKHVNVYYDNSGNNRQSIVKRTPAEDVMLNFRSRGWTVTLMTKGGANASHHSKYWAWQTVIKKKAGFPLIKINEANAEETKLSMQYAAASVDGRKFIHKDKSSEKKGGSQVYATHLSDAADTIIISRFKKGSNIQGVGSIS